MTDIETGTTELLCTLVDRVATVTLNKPDKRNALGDVLTPALREILLKLEADPRVGCVMLTGAGDAFCAGGDVSGMGASGSTVTSAPKSPDERVTDLIRKQEALTLRLHELAKPTVAALPGPAAGAGFSIALACDLRIAADGAFVTTAFRNIGLSGDYGASWFLNRLLGQAKAKELMLLSDRVDAVECLRIGLISAVYPKADFRTSAQAFAASIANGPATALRLMKRNLNRAAELSLRDTLALEAQHMVLSSSSEDAQEAIRAFVEKRKPRFVFR